ncbi:MAG: hypothetical protein ACHQ50_10385 [Fimbriimonadales bacterium]
MTLSITKLSVYGETTGETDELGLPRLRVDAVFGQEEITGRGDEGKVIKPQKRRMKDESECRREGCGGAA